MLDYVESGFKLQYGAEAIHIRGKAVVIVGDINKLGLKTAVLLAEYGAPVFFAARNKAELKIGRAAIAQVGGEGDGLVVDLDQPEEVRRFFEQAEYWLGRIDALVNFIGIEGRAGGEACQNLCMQEALTHMKAGKHGQIINIGRPYAKHGLYMPEKSYASSRLATLRRQAKQQHIRVTSVQPEPGCSPEALDANRVATCVLNSLAQTYSMDVIFLRDLQT